MKPLQLALLILATGAASLNATEGRGDVRVGAGLEATAPVFGWVASDSDHICGIQVPSHISNPATIDLNRALAATEEMRRMKRDGINPNSARGKALKNAAQRRVRDAATTVKDNLGHCSVWKAIRHSDGRTVADVTDQVVAEI
ncbi:MAG: hypothetical protein AAFZ65_15240 [Planctomycetota bacterium]